jgi:glucan phosphoethanolaminetransferase (alkaline phosphatase superfamily)
MDAVQSHLLINHVPILGTLFGTLILLAGFIFKNDTLKVTALVSFIGIALVTIAVFQSGEGAEDPVEEIENIDKKQIHEHEEAAESAAIGAYVLGLLSIASLVIRKKKNSLYNLILIVILAVAAVVFVFMANAGHSGGMIRRPDLQTQTQQIYPSFTIQKV